MDTTLSTVRRRPKDRKEQILCSKATVIAREFARRRGAGNRSLDCVRIFSDQGDPGQHGGAEASRVGDDLFPIGQLGQRLFGIHQRLAPIQFQGLSDRFGVRRADDERHTQRSPHA